MYIFIHFILYFLIKIIDFYLIKFKLPFILNNYIYFNNKLRSMFSESLSSKELDLYNFNTNKVENMPGMFCMCLSLEKLDTPQISTNNAKNIV